MPLTDDGSQLSTRFDSHTDARLPLLPEQKDAWLRFEFNVFDGWKDHPLVHLYSVTVTYIAGAHWEQRNFLVTAEVYEKDDEVTVGYSPHILELDYQPEEGPPRQKSLTERSVTEWLSIEGETTKIRRRMPHEVCGMIRSMLWQFLEQKHAKRRGQQAR